MFVNYQIYLNKWKIGLFFLENFLYKKVKLKRKNAHLIMAAETSRPTKREFWIEPGSNDRNLFDFISKELPDHNIRNLEKCPEKTPDSLRNILQKKKIRRNRTLEGVVQFFQTSSKQNIAERVYSFHNVSIIQKSKIRGTSIPSSAHIILSHEDKKTPKIVFFSEGYASHHNYFSTTWTQQMLNEPNEIRVSLKKSGEQVKLFHFPLGTDLRTHFGPYLLGTKGSFNQKNSPYIQKAIKYLQPDEQNIARFLDRYQLSTIFMEMMVGDQHVFRNPENTPAFYVHGMRKLDGAAVDPNEMMNRFQNGISPMTMQPIPRPGVFLYSSWREFLEDYPNFREKPMYAQEEGVYARSSDGTSIKFKFPEYLVLREMRQSRVGPIMTTDTALSYVNAMFPDMSKKSPDIPIMKVLDVSQQLKIKYARWIREWNLHWTRLKIMNKDRAEKIFAGDFVGELDFFVASVSLRCSENAGDEEEKKLLKQLQHLRPVVYLLMLTGPPGSGKSTQISKILDSAYGANSYIWLTQDVLGTRKILVEKVLEFATWTSTQKPGIYIVVVDRCNPDGASRHRILDEIRNGMSKSLDAPIIWTQHCMLPLPDDPLETLTQRVMLRENHPSLRPDMGIITIAEIIFDHFLNVLEPPLDSINLFIEPGPPESFVKTSENFQMSIPKNVRSKKKERNTMFVGISVFDELPTILLKLTQNRFEIRNSVLHSTLQYFGKNGFKEFVERERDKQNIIECRIYEMCFSRNCQQILGSILGIFVDEEEYGVAGCMVVWSPLTEIGDKKIYHITTHLKNKHSNPFDSNKVLENGDIPFGWNENGKLIWFTEPVPLLHCYGGFATK